MPHLYILTGASRGLGLALAQQLLSPSHHLLCIARSIKADLAAQAKACGCTCEQWTQDLADAPAAAERRHDADTTEETSESSGSPESRNPARATATRSRRSALFTGRPAPVWS